MGSSYGAGSVDTDCPHHKKLRVSRGLMAASFLCLFAWILLLIAFASPYWLSSYAITYSPFVRLGLWDFCFNSYRHPPYQYDEKFTGCHWVYSAKFQNIRDWLQPGWFILVQAMASIAFTFSCLSLITLSIVIMYYLVRHQVVVIIVAFVFQVLTAIPLLVAVIVFGTMAFDRHWLLHPNFNYLDWAYFVAIASLVLSTLSCFLLLSEARFARERAKRMHNLVYNMQQRNPSTNGSRAFLPPEGKPLHQTTLSHHHRPPSVQQPYFTTV